ncbi:MAG: hypothetical protein A2904_00920 [Candidatus Staskawiczbacteria bacterium RIFCSPLOWO2_01_FULL_33_9]|uniref:EamA domain-containing protein n=1 Tax=Candidatus Staskawiczbacteria bacterium RIFCSPLOWO2_01_FULL_33_9 TaxID=1802211 RepID=A0A1G2I961_9BACT|nr:MAG: hypothetical protein A2904_00920 [Candidatus Staskawiczbacteria bacterium RIFCSPLOWO2_01_FULL_33_9]
MNFLVNFLQKFPPLLLVVLAAFSVIVGDIFAKYWSQNPKNPFYIIAVVFYIGSAIFYIPSLLSKGLVITSILWTLISTIGLILVGVVMFKETLSFIQVVGLIFGIISLIILSLGF